MHAKFQVARFQNKRDILHGSLDFVCLFLLGHLQAHIPHAPTLLENAVYNEWQFQALVTGNRTKKGI